MLERLKKDLSYQESFDVTFRKVDGLKKSFIIVFLNFLCNHEAIVEIIYSLEHLNLSKQKDIAKEIYNENTDENILVQGIIDLYYISKDGKLKLIDYKTDYVEKGEENKLIEKYKSQLGLYEKALEKVFKRKVDEKYIYSVYLEKEVKIG